MLPVENTLGISEEGNKGEWWKGEFMCDIFDML
jgi:hypothetical protein